MLPPPLHPTRPTTYLPLPCRDLAMLGLGTSSLPRLNFSAMSYSLPEILAVASRVVHDYPNHFK